MFCVRQYYAQTNCDRRVKVNLNKISNKLANNTRTYYINFKVGK